MVHSRLLAVACLPLLLGLLTACGGASDGSPGSGSSLEQSEQVAGQVTSPDPALVGPPNATLIPVVSSNSNSNTRLPGGIDLPSAGGASVRYVTLVDSGFETSIHPTIGEGWIVNYWGSPTPVWTQQLVTGPQAHTGSAAQLFRLTSKGSGDAQLAYPYSFVPGKTYRATVYLRAAAPANVVVFMRNDDWPYQSIASRTVSLGTQWQKVEIQGAYIYKGPGSVRVASKTLGAEIYVDSMKLEEVEYNPYAPVSTAAIADTFFGMHIHQYGTHSIWPSVRPKLIRLWDTGTKWRDLEPAQDQWAFEGSSNSRMDLYVSFIKSGDPDAEILYTLGQTPQWASSSPTYAGYYGLGATGAPSNMNDWRDYVRTLARRYVGKIRYWELWNESDYAQAYTGSVQQMVEMARIAQEELKAADPNNKLVSPGLSGSGLSWLESFFAQGGGAYIDIVGFHYYWEAAPETHVFYIDNLREVMKAYGQQNKPLWNTEGTLYCNGALRDCSTYVLTDAQRRGGYARGMFMMAYQGVQAFAHYDWERSLVEADFVTLTDLGRTYQELMRWFRGAQVVDGYAAADKVYAFKLRTGSKDAWALWSSEPGTVVNLPTAWTMTKQRSLLGVESAIPNSRQLVLGPEPVLLTD